PPPPARTPPPASCSACGPAPEAYPLTVSVPPPPAPPTSRDSLTATRLTYRARYFNTPSGVGAGGCAYTTQSCAYRLLRHAANSAAVQPGTAPRPKAARKPATNWPRKTRLSTPPRT